MEASGELTVNGDDDFQTEILSSDDLFPPNDGAAHNVEADTSDLTPVDQELRRSTRIAGGRVDAFVCRALPTSMSIALKNRSKESKEAIQAELTQTLEKRVWSYITTNELDAEQRKKLIRSHMFLKDKFKFVVFDKVKARLVAGGDKQDKTLYDIISFPTVSLEAVLSIISIVAIEHRKIATVDITGAYLECMLPEGDDVFMILDPTTAMILQQIDPIAILFRAKNGTLYVKLLRALYGCVQYARLWYEKLRDTLFVS